jgi:hypothetical protein
MKVENRRLEELKLFARTRESRQMRFGMYAARRGNERSQKAKGFDPFMSQPEKARGPLERNRRGKKMHETKDAMKPSFSVVVSQKSAASSLHLRAVSCTRYAMVGVTRVKWG